MEKSGNRTFGIQCSRKISFDTDFRGEREIQALEMHVSVVGFRFGLKKSNFFLLTNVS